MGILQGANRLEGQIDSSKCDGEILAVVDQSTTKKNRRVCFGSATIYSYTSEVSDHMKEELWWSRSDIQRFRSERRFEIYAEALEAFFKPILKVLARSTEVCGASTHALGEYTFLS